MSKLGKNKITGIVLALVGALYAWMSLQLKKPSDPTDPGSALFPIIASIGLILCGIVIFFSKKNEDAKPTFTKAGWANIFVVMGVLALYVFLLDYLGFIITTPFMLFAVASLFSKGKGVTLRRRIIYSVAVTAALYVFFVVIFDVAIPMGFFY